MNQYEPGRPQAPVGQPSQQTEVGPGRTSRNSPICRYNRCREDSEPVRSGPHPKEDVTSDPKRQHPIEPGLTAHPKSWARRSCCYGAPPLLSSPPPLARLCCAARITSSAPAPPPWPPTPPPHFRRSRSSARTQYVPCSSSFVSSRD
jgi:hypothetical protein